LNTVSDQFRPRLGPKPAGERTKEELNKNEPAREPISNEIPDSVNVRANLAPGANVPGAVENESDSRHQLNLGKHDLIKPPYHTICFYIDLFCLAG
jgi:hypothetical protein